jgi:hypothetical protein
VFASSPQNTVEASLNTRSRIPESSPAFLTTSTSRCRRSSKKILQGNQVDQAESDTRFGIDEHIYVAIRMSGAAGQ